MKTTEQQLEELIEDRKFIISTNSTGQGKYIYDELPPNDSILGDTIIVNAKTVEVDRLFDLKEEFGPAWSEKLWELVLEREAGKICRSLKKNSEQSTDEIGRVPIWKINGKWQGGEDVAEIAYKRAYDQLSESYNIPESVFLMKGII